MPDLTPHNTMALRSEAVELHELTDEAEIAPFIKRHHAKKNALPLFVLSGGSNVLLPPKLAACVLKPNLLGINKVSETDSHVFVEAMAGESWHSFVMRTLEAGWFGLENLALIPGLVGAAPVQNIGAYGVEIKDRLHRLYAINLHTGEQTVFDSTACAFGYRDSFFKRCPNTWLITKVVFKLSKVPSLVVSYADVERLASKIAHQQGFAAPTPKSVAEAVIHIRQNKLPNPKTIPNCGSFFQNPIVEKSLVNALLTTHPNMPHHQQDNPNLFKLAAGWLIDQAGLKGRTQSYSRSTTKARIGTCPTQALVVVNHTAGVSTQADIGAFSEFIETAVLERFGVRLHREPVWVSYDGSCVDK